MNDKGISLIVLVITIIILIVLASITFEYGKTSINNAKLETLKTNMLLIKAKAMEYVEQANFKAGPSNSYKDLEDNLKTEIAQELKGTPDSGSYVYITLQDGQYLYDVTNELENMGIKDVNLASGEKYLVRYDVRNATVEVYNTKGFDINGTMKYSLTELQQ